MTRSFGGTLTRSGLLRHPFFARPAHTRVTAAGRDRRWGLTLLVAAVLCSSVALPAQAAEAEQADRTVSSAPGVAPSAGSTPTPSPSAAGIPTIQSPPNGSFIGKSVTTVSGTRTAGQKLQLLDSAGRDLCIIPAAETTTWSCEPLLPNGSSLTLRVVVEGESALSSQITVSVLGEPTVIGGRTGSALSDGSLSGRGEPGARVTARHPAGVGCTGTADGSGNWVCLLEGTVPDGAAAITASQQKSSISGPSSSNASRAVSIRFDMQRPAAPVLSAPGAGSRVDLAGTTYSGTGETGTTVTVFAGPYSVCQAPVLGGAWQCTAGGVAAGTYEVIAIQQDEAGNVSAGSVAISVRYANAGPVTVTPETSTPPSTAPSSSTTATPEPPAAPSTAPVAPVEPPSDDTDDPAAGLPPGQWNDPTLFASAVPSPWYGSAYPWLNAVLLALGAVLLLAIPARLLAATVAGARGGRPLWAPASVAGRNRAREEFETAPTLSVNRWLQGAIALVAAATLVMLSGPILDQPAYLRLLLAVVIALFLVNLVGALLPRLWSSRVLQAPATQSFLPRYLLLVFLTAIGSRLFEIQPALLFGLLGSVTLVTAATPVQRGQLAAVRTVSLIALAATGWLVLGLLPGATSFGTALIAEIATTVVLASVGSAVFILVPIGATSGRSILSWSPAVWVGLTLVAYTLLFAVLSPVVELWQSDGTVALLWVAAAGFAALSLSVWAWQRFVVPSQNGV